MYYPKHNMTSTIGHMMQDLIIRSNDSVFPSVLGLSVILRSYNLRLL